MLKRRSGIVLLRCTNVLSGGHRQKCALQEFNPATAYFRARESVVHTLENSASISEPGSRPDTSHFSSVSKWYPTIARNERLAKKGQIPSKNVKEGFRVAALQNCKFRGVLSACRSHGEGDESLL